jgi:hypothetical protein
VAQRGSQSAAASAVNKLAVRLAAGSDRLAELVRRDQDLASEADRLDKAVIAVSPRPDRTAASRAIGRGLRRSPSSASPCKRLLQSSFPITQRCRIRCH